MTSEAAEAVAHEVVVVVVMRVRGTAMAEVVKAVVADIPKGGPAWVA